MKAFLHIAAPYESRTIEVTGEISVGRTELADVVIDDTGLSRKNTTFFIDEGELWAADENSTNGTFLNGERMGKHPQKLRNGDRLSLGSTTTIRVEIAAEGAAESQGKAAAAHSAAELPQAAESLNAPGFNSPFYTSAPAASDADGAAPPASRQQGPPILVAASVILTIFILLAGGLGIYIISQTGTPDPKGPGGGRRITASAIIPVRVIDPLGGEDEDDLDDLISSWEVAEEEIVAADVADVTVTSAEAEEAELSVSAAFLADRQRLALEDRPGEKGIRPAGLSVPKELFGDGVIKQKAKLREMNGTGYRQPMDFADLAAKRLSRELIEMPMAAQSFYLDVGGSAQDTPFTSFSFQEGTAEIVPGTPKFDILKRLADNFSGQSYDLGNAEHRKQMRRRLLRMFQPRAKPILRELADAYFQRFQRPLRVTSLTRSMDYQILLNSNNPNSFKVRGEGALPPHTSGCAFDLARKHMPVEEQNFLMQKLAEMERSGKLDALIEYGVNACFHIFIYNDGVPPHAFNFSSVNYETFPLLTRF